MKYKTYVIENKEFNAVDLGKELGMSQQSARNRLKVATTIDELYHPLHSKTYKKHVIEGKQFTSPQVAKILNCSDSTARARLFRSNTIKELLKPLHDRSIRNKPGPVINLDSDDIDSRMTKLLLGAW